MKHNIYIILSPFIFITIFLYSQNIEKEQKNNADSIKKAFLRHYKNLYIYESDFKLDTPNYSNIEVRNPDNRVNFYSYTVFTKSKGNFYEDLNNNDVHNYSLYMDISEDGSLMQIGYNSNKFFRKDLLDKYRENCGTFKMLSNEYLIERCNNILKKYESDLIEYKFELIRNLPEYYSIYEQKLNIEKEMFSQVLYYIFINNILLDQDGVTFFIFRLDGTIKYFNNIMHFQLSDIDKSIFQPKITEILAASIAYEYLIGEFQKNIIMRILKTQKHEIKNSDHKENLMMSINPEYFCMRLILSNNLKYGSKLMFKSEQLTENLFLGYKVYYNIHVYDKSKCDKSLLEKEMYLIIDAKNGEIVKNDIVLKRYEITPSHMDEKYKWSPEQMGLEQTSVHLFDQKIEN